MGVGGQHHAPAALPTGKTRYALYRRLGGLQGRSGRARKTSPTPGFDARIVQPVASRYTDLAIAATKRVPSVIPLSALTSESSNWSSRLRHLHEPKWTFYFWLPTSKHLLLLSKQAVSRLQTDGNQVPRQQVAKDDTLLQSVLYILTIYSAWKWMTTYPSAEVHLRTDTFVFWNSFKR